MEFMPNESYFLLESIVLSAIFTAWCSSGSNIFHQNVWTCLLIRPSEERENPYIWRLLSLKYLELTLYLFTKLQMDIVTS